MLLHLPGRQQLLEWSVAFPEGSDAACSQPASDLRACLGDTTIRPTEACAWLQDLTAFIKDAQDAGGCVLVHCFAGDTHLDKLKW